jgi:hypothetical protein
VLLCERTLAYQGTMRALAEAQTAGGDPDQLREPLADDDEDLEDEVEPQDLDGLQLGMEVLNAGGDGARVAG